MKAKITMIIEWDFETKPEDYQGLNLKTDSERLQFDIDQTRENPWQVLEIGDWEVKEVKGELVKEVNPHD